MSANQLMIKTLLMIMIMEKYKTFWKSSTKSTKLFGEVVQNVQNFLGKHFGVKHQSSPILFYINDLAEGVVVLLIEFAVILGWKGLPALWRNGSLSKFSCN